MPACTADDLQNLSACARQVLVNLKPAELAIVATALAHAEADITEMRKPVEAHPAQTVEIVDTEKRVSVTSHNQTGGVTAANYP